MRRSLWAGCIGLAVLSGCCCNPGQGAGSGPTLSDAAKFKPDARPGEKAKLVLAGTEIPVEVKRRNEGEIVILEFWAHGEIIQQERYESKTGAFSLVMAGGERYEPALPLLKFPMDVGSKWSWSGATVAGDNPHKAKAEIKSSTDQLYAEGPETAVKVVVELELESGGPLPAKRTLTFWFVEGRGVVRREFGAGSAREPG